MARRHTHILFDFFGTLVDYSPSRTEQGFGRSHDLLRLLGADLDYEGFLDAWSETSAGFDRASDLDNSEFSMVEVSAQLLAGLLPREPRHADVQAFAETYVEEWNRGVRYLPGVPELVARLAHGYRLAVVTNTHHPSLVPGHLAAMGMADAFAALVASVDVGWRKPHPKIYAAALAALGIDPVAAIFVGDSYQPDYLGPERAGMTAYLIDPDRRAPVPADRRLDSIFDLPARLASGYRG